MEVEWPDRLKTQTHLSIMLFQTKLWKPLVCAVFVVVRGICAWEVLKGEQSAASWCRPTGVILNQILKRGTYFKTIHRRKAEQGFNLVALN